MFSFPLISMFISYNITKIGNSWLICLCDPSLRSFHGDSKTSSQKNNFQLKLYISTCACRIFWIFLDVFLLFFTINLSFCFITTSLLFQTNLSPGICSWCFLDIDPKVWLGTMFFNQKLRKFLKMFIQYDE